MVSPPPEGFAKETYYRRGAVMGLTVAEAFMLVAFILMMMFLLWRFAMEDEMEKLPELKEISLILIEKPDIRDIAEAAGRLPEETRRKLGDLIRRPDASATVELADRLSEADRMALRDGAVPIAPRRLEDLEDAARLVEKPEDRQLAEAAKSLSAERKRTLSGLLSRSDGGDMIEKADDLQEALRERSAEQIEEAIELRDHLDPYGEDSNEEIKQKIEQLIAQGERLPNHLAEEESAALQDMLHERSAEQIEEALELRDHLDPYGEDSNEEIKQKIGRLIAQGTQMQNRLAEEEQARRDLIDDLKAGLGAQVAEAGGRIEPSGRIVFDDTVLFDVGQHDIRSDAAVLLDKFCPSWLRELKRSASRREIDEALIEGHSSSEWKDAETSRDAWDRNLELSQRRAQAVLVRCLNIVDGTPLGDWSRPKLAAIGYSSSRPILDDSGEDMRRSRRVVFGIRLSREQLLEEMGADAARGSGIIESLRGPARVKDADTIEISGFNVRLDGIDALEKKQTCVRDNGTPWPCGLQAVRAVEEHVNGRTVVCEELALGLSRYRGRCRVDGGDLNRWVVREGWAFAYTKYSDEYAPDEASARTARRGAWAGKQPIPPWEWRKEKRGRASLSAQRRQ